jgi:hypothetical protein
LSHFNENKNKAGALRCAAHDIFIQISAEPRETLLIFHFSASSPARHLISSASPTVLAVQLKGRAARFSSLLALHFSGKTNHYRIHKFLVANNRKLHPPLSGLQFNDLLCAAQKRFGDEEINFYDHGSISIAIVVVRPCSSAGWKWFK